MWTPKISVTNALCGQSVAHDAFSKLGFAKWKRVISCPYLTSILPFLLLLESKKQDMVNFWGPSSHSDTKSQVNQVNYTAWCHTMGPVTLMKWDSPTAPLPHNPAGNAELYFIFTHRIHCCEYSYAPANKRHGQQDAFQIFSDVGMEIRL